MDKKLDIRIAEDLKAYLASGVEDPPQLPSFTVTRK